MNKRIQNFQKIHNDAFYGPEIKKLKKADKSLIVEFLEKTINLTDDEFAHAVNRMFIGHEKPKNYTRIMEILICSK